MHRLERVDIDVLVIVRHDQVNKRIQVESKADVRKRIGRSTDNADALLLAFYQPADDGRTEQRAYEDDRLKGRR